MFTFKLINHIDLTELPDWEALKTDVLGHSIHPHRAQGFYLAREAMRQCFKELSLELAIKDLVLENYDKLKNYPLFTVSLSHTPQWGAAVIGDRKQYQAFGIDIEHRDRTVKKPILERISNIKDIAVDPLMLWTLKEASFKALMNTRNFMHPIEFSSIEISQDNWVHSPSKIEGEWKVIDDSELMVAIAWIKT